MKKLLGALIMLAFYTVSVAVVVAICILVGVPEGETHIAMVFEEDFTTVDEVE